jgi:HEAT repeat-containing taxis protein
MQIHSRVTMGDDAGPEQADDDARLAHYLDLLSDQDPINRWKGATSLGRMGDLRAVEALISALDDDDDRVRLKTIWALGSIGDSRAAAPLKKRYRLESDDIKEMIAEALEAINRAARGP